MLKMEVRENMRDSERRKKRVLVPAFYFLAEMMVLWLVLSLIQLKFNPLIWNTWAIFIFMLVVSYSIAKTIHVYRRQKNYPVPDSTTE